MTLAECLSVALLELLDGSDARDGVIVIVASNYPDHLDPALRRPGRLDCHIEIGLPDSSARAQMLLMHLNLEPLVRLKAFKTQLGLRAAIPVRLSPKSLRMRGGLHVVTAERLSFPTCWL
ncbi:AAA family ATPase [Rhizobium sp.]|uniref:AAA family ATPase n=1 Tax=Rhizobium sp. TaxID=391 RepID=UPI002AA683B4